eukprot:PhM_4_TR18007/c0_g1_i5/m.89096
MSRKLSHFFRYDLLILGCEAMLLTGCDPSSNVLLKRVRDVDRDACVYRVGSPEVGSLTLSKSREDRYRFGVGCVAEIDVHFSWIDPAHVAEACRKVPAKVQEYPCSLLGAQFTTYGDEVFHR